MKGWEFIFLPDITVPFELPVEINSFKAQQCRWAKGAMQTCRKTLPRMLRSDFNPAEKLEAWYHLTGNVSYPLMVILTLLLFPAMIVRYNQGWFELVTIDLPLFVLSFSSVTTFYLTSQRILSKKWHRQILYLPGLMALGIGMMISGTKVVLEGALGIHSPFVRTPKYSVEGNSGDWKAKKYRGRVVVQGTITKMAEIAPSERRKIIDDMVGIAQSDAEKAEAEDKLRQADIQIKTATGRIDEVQKRVDDLEPERNELLRANFIRDEIKKFETIRISHEIAQIQKSIGETTSQADKVRHRVDKLRQLRDDYRLKRRDIEGEWRKLSSEMGVEICAQAE